MFQTALANGGSVRAINAKGAGAEFSRKELDALGEFVKTYRAKGLIWMNDNFRKQNGKRFTRNDVQAYIMRGHLPEYLGGNEIVVTPKKHCTIKMYNVLENDNNPVMEEEENECIGSM